MFNLFTDWILGGISIHLLNKLSGTGLSNKTLQRHFHSFLNTPPKPKKLNSSKHINLKIDAKYFGRWGCTIVLKETTNIIFWHFCNRENYHNYIYCFSKLSELGYILDSVTSDKHGSILASVKASSPCIPHQFCTVHIQRRCQTLLTRNPETQAGKNLLELVFFINKINSYYKKAIFIKWLERYELRWKHFFNHRTYSKNPYSSKKWWYTHKNLRTAFRTLKSSINNMFLYLDNSNIPKDTNGLEAEFTHLKNKLNAHRGLTRERVPNFVNWYWFLKSKKN